MKLTTDEHRALNFIAALLFLSAAVRLVGLPEPVEVPGDGSFDLRAHIEAVEGAVAEQETMDRPLAPGESLDPNTAPVAQLARLPRVGPALAARIVADRDAHGPYRTLADLERVPGLGARTVERLAAHLTLPPGHVDEGGRAGRTAVLAPGSRTAGQAASQAASQALDLNRATAEELAGLPGIGPVLAGRIVAFRDSVGGFDAVADLAGVKGIGAATLARLGPLLRVR